MGYAEHFTDAELERIRDEATIYMCACPAQVAAALSELRKLYRYQLGCLEDSNNLASVHRTIADSAVLAHAELQTCLDRVLEIEQWDRATLRMPEGLRRRQMKVIEDEE